MADLKIWFDQMFLLVKDEANPVVLFPTGADQEMRHRLYILGAKPNVAIQVKGADLSFWQTPKGGTRAQFWGKKDKLDWPDRDELLDFKTLASPPASQIKKKFYSKETTASCPTELHARLYTPFGDFDAHRNSREHGDARWKVGPPGHKKKQRLTDLMSFECDLDKNATYELRVDVAGEFTYIPLQTEAGQDIEIVFFNNDMPPDKNKAVVAYTPPGPLSDFDVIYALAEGGATFEVPQYDSAGIPMTRTHRPEPDTKTTECVGAHCKRVEDFSGTNPAFPICGGGTGEP